MTQTLLLMITMMAEPLSASIKPLPGTICDTGVRPLNRRSGTCLSHLALDAYAKAERARSRWRAAKLAGDTETAHQARRLMLKHQVIAWHLDPTRRAAGDRA